MGLGMVRKIDELGRVVLPKEMRRVLNIKTGSSVEMVINEEGKIVIKKFSEVENVLFMAKKLGEVLFEKLNLRGFICDEDKIVFVFGGISKKDFFGKKVRLEDFKKSRLKIKEVVEVDNEGEVRIFPINFQGFDKGLVGIFGENKDDKYIDLLIQFFDCLVEE